MTINGKLHYLVASDSGSEMDMPLLVELPTGGTYQDINVMATEDAGDAFLNEVPTLKVNEWHVENEVLTVVVNGRSHSITFQELKQSYDNFGGYVNINYSDGIYYIDDAGPGYIVLRRNGYLYPMVWYNNGLWHPYIIALGNDDAFCLVANDGPTLYEDNTFYFCTTAQLEVDEEHGKTEAQIVEEISEMLLDDSNIKGIRLVEEWSGDSETRTEASIPFLYG